jgi:hypothetical protein
MHLHQHQILERLSVQSYAGFSLTADPSRFLSFFGSFLLLILSCEEHAFLGRHSKTNDPEDCRCSRNSTKKGTQAQLPQILCLCYDATNDILAVHRLRTAAMDAAMLMQRLVKPTDHDPPLVSHLSDAFGFQTTAFRRVRPLRSFAYEPHHDLCLHERDAICQVP